MSGSGEKHTLYFYVHRERFATAPNDAWWQQRVADATVIASAPRNVAIHAAARVLSGGVLGQPGAAHMIPDMLTLSLVDPAIIDAARQTSMNM